MQQPHAIIAAPNNLEVDARAHRNGLALQAAGFRVTMVGFGDGIPQSGSIVGLPYVLCQPRAKAAAKRPPSFVYRAVRKAFHLTLRRRPPQRVLTVVAQIDQAQDALTNRVRRAARAVVPRRSQTAQAGATWREMLPQVPVMIESMKPTLIELQPDLIVTDVHLLPLAAEVRTQFHAQGHQVGLVYDAREYVYGLASDDPNITQGFPALESDYIRDMDATITVCEPIARFLRDKYALAVEPPLVPNAPLAKLPAVDRPMTVRDVLNVPADAQILVYAGGLSYHRGVHDVIEALPQLPGVHLALGARRSSSYVVELRQQAERLQVADRLHFVPFAPTHEVAEYLATATAAIFPFHPVGNHNWAAPNKYYESVQARLPIITSNMEWLEERVTRLGIGEVFEWGDPSSIVSAVRTTLDNLESYRSKYTEELVAQHSFEHFAGVVQDVCKAATSERALQGLRAKDLGDNLGSLRRDMLHQRAHLADAEIFDPRPWLRIGCVNTGGQPRQWAAALMREHPEVIAESVWLKRDQPFSFPSDEVVTHYQWASPAWQRQVRRKLDNRVTHVLTESGRPVLGATFGRFFYAENEYFKDSGIARGLVFHGSDIRNPARHAELEPDSPFLDPADELTAVLQRQVDALAPHVSAFDGHVFVTTNDLLDYLPDATWLPVVVDTDAWLPSRAPMSSGKPPAVFHVPSRGSMKGSDDVDAVCELLQTQGRIRYLREDGLSHLHMRELMLQADIVIDQLRLGDYGITAVEGMAAGKVVVGHVADRVRARIEGEVPIVEATNRTLADVLDALLTDPGQAPEWSRRSREYALRWHDGRAAGRVLADFMRLT